VCATGFALGTKAVVLLCLKHPHVAVENHDSWQLRQCVRWPRECRLRRVRSTAALSKVQMLVGLGWSADHLACLNHPRVSVDNRAFSLLAATPACAVVRTMPPPKSAFDAGIVNVAMLVGLDRGGRGGGSGEGVACDHGGGGSSGTVCGDNTNLASAGVGSQN
jgi:hypothetical protein